MHNIFTWNIVVAYFNKGGMKMGYKIIIIELVKKINDNDVLFLNQIYTIIEKHIEKKGKSN